MKYSLIFIYISLACLIAYPIISGILGCFEIGTMILLFVLTVPCQLTIHLVFTNAVKTNNFSMLAGFDSRIEYNTAEYKNALKAIDLCNGCSSAVYIFLICVFGCISIQNEWLIPAMLFLYVFTLIGNILVINFKYADKLFVNEIDCKRCRRSLPVNAVFILEILLCTVAECVAFASHNVENNTTSAFGLCCWMFIGLIAAIIGLVSEEKRLKKWDPDKEKYLENTAIPNHQIHTILLSSFFLLELNELRQ